MLVDEIYVIKLTTEEGKYEEIEFTILEDAEAAYELYVDDDYFTSCKLIKYNFKTKKEETLKETK